MDSFHVLLVDDESDFVDTLVKRLTKRKLICTGVYSGEDALQYMTQNKVDVIALDVRMPGKSGMETLKEIKSRYPLVEVVLLTGHASINYAIEGMESGAFDYLMKPVEIDVLLYKLQDAYQKKSLQEEKLKHLKQRKQEVETQ